MPQTAVPWKNWGKKFLERKLIITREQEGILTSIWENGKAVELRLEKDQEDIRIGDIYIGKVKKIVKNIQAAFIEIMPGVECYYSIEENPSPIYTAKQGRKGLAAGDELLVQVCRESSKTKQPTVTSCLNFTGTYVVLTWAKCRIGVSGKISGEDRERLKELLEPLKNDQYGYIIRTNASTAKPEEILKEAQSLSLRCMDLIEKSGHRTCFSKLDSMPPSFLGSVRDAYEEGLVEIVAEDEAIYEALSAYLKEHRPKDLPMLRRYQDDLLSLSSLYGIRGVLEEALRQKVWLSSGAYLVIQPTEALTVIDVNTGKYSEKKKNSQDTYLKINLEAAREAARQLRLRNLSGIVIIDFINMERKEDQQMLLDALNAHLKRDPIKTVLVDMTPLNLVEITRKKVRRPLYEEFAKKRGE